MNLNDLIGYVRMRLKDSKGKDINRLWKDLELSVYATDAEAEIARRLYLLSDSDTIGYLTITGTAGQIDSVSVSGVAVVGAPIAYAVSAENTAVLVAAAITAYASTPKYRARAVGTRVFVRAVPKTGYPAAGYTLASTASGGLTVTATTLTGLCRHVLTVGQRYLPLHESIIKITRVKPDSQSRPIPVYRKDEIDAAIPDWEEQENDDPQGLIVDYDAHEAIVFPPPDVVDVLEIDCYRLPLVAFTTDDMKQFPEIAARYHVAMTDWMMKLAYEKRDLEETYDPVKAGIAEKSFEARIEAWRVERIRNTPGNQTNSVPPGLM